ncbi:MAG: GNAT family N-acetyltransferase [Geminicoccaceae bacterium]
MQVLAMRVLGAAFYSEAQIAGLLAHVDTMDDYLLEESTYYVAESGGIIVASGGWSGRRPGYELVGSEAADAEHPARATIRSVFVHPAWAGRGLARRLVTQAEAQARSAGHREMRLTATLAGEPLYRRLGYIATRRATLRFPHGGEAEVVPMRKTLDECAAPCRREQIPAGR